jgi:poly(A) polymerase
LLLRYGTSSQGNVIRKARVYSADEHGIRMGMIDPDAVWAIRKLTDEGHRAYVVGGAIRDLLLGKKPKDFDVATDAQPNRIRRIFRRSRIIGRRFRIVHLYFDGGKIIEVSTFRASGEGVEGNNIYGTLAEDVVRRDYSLNALFYDPLKEQLIDYVDGLHDVRKRRLRILAPADISFAEDPVRMLRAVKYSAPHGLRVPLRLRMAIRKRRLSLLECSADRLTEEFNKIMASGHAAAILRQARRFGLFDVLFPAVAARLSTAAAERAFFERVEALDRDAAAGNIDRPVMLLEFFGDVVRAAAPDRTLPAVQAALKDAATPLRLTNRDTLDAAHKLVGRRHSHVAAAEERVEDEAADSPPGKGGAPGAARPRRRRRRRGSAGGEGGQRPQSEVAAARPQAAEPTGGHDEQDGPPADKPRRRRRRRRRGGQRSVDMRASKESTFSP